MKPRLRLFMRVLAFDPGTRNLGWAVLDDTLLIGAGVSSIVRAHTTFDTIAHDCSIMLEDLIDRYAPDMVVVERQMRDSFIAVAQSLMTASLCFNVPATILHPATWMRLVGLRGTGSHAGNKERNVRFVCDTLGYSVVKNHNLCDAILIGLAAIYSSSTSLPSPD